MAAAVHFHTAATVILHCTACVRLKARISVLPVGTHYLAGPRLPIAGRRREPRNPAARGGGGRRGGHLTHCPACMAKSFSFLSSFLPSKAHTGSSLPDTVTLSGSDIRIGSPPLRHRNHVFAGCSAEAGRLRTHALHHGQSRGGRHTVPQPECTQVPGRAPKGSPSQSHPSQSSLVPPAFRHHSPRQGRHGPSRKERPVDLC